MIVLFVHLTYLAGLCLRGDNFADCWNSIECLILLYLLFFFVSSFLWTQFTDVLVNSMLQSLYASMQDSRYLRTFVFFPLGT